jgi:hypothetical protein
MTPDEREEERAALLAELDTPGPLTEDQKRRIADLAAADAAEPLTPFEEALHEVLQETVALSDRTLAPGLNFRLVGEVIEVLSHGEVVGTVNRQAVADREAQIVAGRRAN